MKVSLNRQTRPKLHAKARLQRDELRKTDLLLLPETVVQLNATAACLLALCDGSKTVEEIMDFIQKLYDDPQTENDAYLFLQEAATNRWLTIATEVASHE